MSPFGLQLRFMRNERGVSLKTLSASVGVSQKSLSAIETGRRSPPDEGMVKKIGLALDLSTSELLKLQESADQSSPALRIPYGTTPRAYRLAHRLVMGLNRLSTRDMDAIQAILEDRKTALSQRREMR